MNEQHHPAQVTSFEFDRFEQLARAIVTTPDPRKGPVGTAGKTRKEKERTPVAPGVMQSSNDTP